MLQSTHCYFSARSYVLEIVPEFLEEIISEYLRETVSAALEWSHEEVVFRKPKENEGQLLNPAIRL
ncbi:MAG: hypothetical protein WB053_04355 [Nitrososphaeraceae archaeon]